MSHRKDRVSEDFSDKNVLKLTCMNSKVVF